MNNPIWTFNLFLSPPYLSLSSSLSPSHSFLRKALLSRSWTINNESYINDKFDNTWVSIRVNVNEFHAFIRISSSIRLFLFPSFCRSDSAARHSVALLTDLHATQEWVISTLHFARDFVSWCYIQRINNAGHARQVYTPTTPKSLFMRELLHAEREMLFCMPPHTYERVAELTTIKFVHE